MNRMDEMTRSAVVHGMGFARWAAFCMVVFCAFGAAADEPAAREIVYPLYTVTVEEGTTNYLYDSTVSVLSEAGGTAQDIAFSTLAETEGALTTGTFQKLGRGFLISSTNMVTWLGEIWIDEGAILLDWRGELGPTNATAGAVRIANGASIGLIADTMTSQTMKIYNTIYLSGEGINGYGVLFNAARCGGNYMRKAFLGNLEFEGDAKFGGWVYDFGCDGEHRLNGHTLTISMSSGNYLTNGGKFRNGHVVVEKGAIYPQSGLTFYGGVTNTLTIKSGAKFGGYHANNLTTPWTLVLEDGASITFGGDSDTTKTRWENTAYDDWEGPVNLLGKTTVTTTSGGAQYAFPFPIRGMLYGPGWFNVTRGWLRLTNPTNCFTGPISINQGDRRYWAGVGFHSATAWPEDNWNVFTNKDGAIQLSAADVRLPDLDVTASGGSFTNTTIFGTGSATARSLVKRGPGLLKIDAVTSVTGITELVEGSIRLPSVEYYPDTLYSDAPGLVEHRVFYSANLTHDEWKGFQRDGVFPQKSTLTNETFAIKSTPALANKTGGSSSWPDYHFVSYDGYIWNRSPTNETWSFALGVCHRGAIAIDGVVVCESVTNINNGSYSSTSKAVWPYLRTNTVDVAPGPHAFSARVGNGSYATAGARQVYNTWNDEAGAAYVATSSSNPVFPWPKDFGCVFNRDGVMSTNSACYTRPSNGTLAATEIIKADSLVGGDGYLFTRTTNEVADCDFDSLRVWGKPIWYFKGHGGETLLDINNPGLTLEVKTLEGATTVTNGHLRVMERLVVDANAVAAGDVLKCCDRLLLGADAVVAVAETGHVRNSPEGGWTAAEADGGITLPEGWLGRVEFPDGKYRLSLSADGKRLMLEHFNGMAISIR